MNLNMMTMQTILLIQSHCNGKSKQQFQMTQSLTILHDMYEAYTKSSGEGETPMKKPVMMREW